MVENCALRALCSGCQLPILDRYLLRVLDKPWHLECVRCVDCSCRLDESCFFRDNLILCRADFERRYGARCAACNLPLESKELVRKARDSFYHCQCFRCIICQRLLDTGEQLYIVDGYKFVCRDDFFASQLNVPSSSSVSRFPHVSDDCLSDYDDELDVDVDNRACTTLSNESTNSGAEDAHKSLNGDDSLSSIQKRRGPRTTIKAKQLDILKAAFASTPKPTRHIREQLAAETGLNMRVIQVWYQNRRSKERRMKQMRANGTYRTTRRQRSSSSMQSLVEDGNDSAVAQSLTSTQSYMGIDMSGSIPSSSADPTYFADDAANSIFASPDLYTHSSTAPIDRIEEFVVGGVVPSTVSSFIWPPMPSATFGSGFDPTNGGIDFHHRPAIS